MEFGWLIEHNNHNRSHLWLRAIIEDEFTGTARTRLDWDGNATVALRFAREEDARAFIYLHRDFCQNCRPTSHSFGA